MHWQPHIPHACDTQSSYLTDHTLKRKRWRPIKNQHGALKHSQRASHNGGVHTLRSQGEPQPPQRYPVSRSKMYLASSSPRSLCVYKTLPVREQSTYGLHIHERDIRRSHTHRSCLFSRHLCLFGTYLCTLPRAVRLSQGATDFHW